MEAKIEKLRKELNNSTIALLETIQGDDDEKPNQTGDDHKRVLNSRDNICGISMVETDW